MSRVLTASLVLAIAMFATTTANAGLFKKHCGAEPACEPACEPVCEPVCAPAPVCPPACPPAPVCPPPPVKVSLCVVDPCTCCSYEVCVCVPAECACETPCLAGWKPGFLGRKVLTYKYPCGHCVEVVITKHGKTIVRG